LERLLEKSEKTDRILKIITALTASSSIGAWAIWNKYSMLWGSAIAASQVITAITPYLPYKGQIKAYSALINELNALMLEAEKKWLSISEGELTKNDIHKTIFAIKIKKQALLRKHIKTTLPKNAKFHDDAERESSDYLSSSYNN
jgi:exo-beta-1,3-glucanase (GH17 family)